MRKKVALFVVAILSQSLFSMEGVPAQYVKYIVVSSGVSIRDNPSASSKILKDVSFPEIIEVYEIKGSGNMLNGILDKWARISKDNSENNSEWINYYYITPFPFVVSSRKSPIEYEGDDYEKIIIKDYFTKDGKLYFNVERMLNEYYHKDIKFDALAQDVIQGIRLTDNAWTRLYNFCDNFRDYIKKINPALTQTWNIEIDDETVILDYGIHVGMSWDSVVEIFGSAYDQQNFTWNIQEGKRNTYAAMYIGHGHWLRFYVVNNKVVKITYMIEK